MPIFEYTCRNCGEQFEALVSRSATPSCPACTGVQVERRLSVFAVAGAGSRRAVPTALAPCGRCGDPRGPGACRTD